MPDSEIEQQPGDLIVRNAINFVYHPPKGDQVERYAELRTMTHSLADFFVKNAPPSRELSLALTKLEEAVMWCNAAIARNE